MHTFGLYEILSTTELLQCNKTSFRRTLATEHILLKYHSRQKRHERQPTAKITVTLNGERCYLYVLQRYLLILEYSYLIIHIDGQALCSKIVRKYKRLLNSASYQASTSTLENYDAVKRQWYRDVKLDVLPQDVAAFCTC